VDVLAPDDLWTVGAYASGSGPTRLIAHYDTTWPLLYLPAPTTGGNPLNGVAALGSRDAWAVGWSAACWRCGEVHFALRDVG
jgi:hypothetical protein